MKTPLMLDTERIWRGQTLENARLLGFFDV